MKALWREYDKVRLRFNLARVAVAKFEPANERALEGPPVQCPSSLFF